MQFSKMLSDNIQITNKLQKLKLQIDGASQHKQLQKCSGKLMKICEKAARLSDKNDSIKIMELVRSTEGLIHLKKKKIKKNIINKLNLISVQVDESLKEKTLQYSRSMQNFDPNKLISPKNMKTNTEIQTLNDRTSVQINHKSGAKLQKRIEQLQDQLHRHKKMMNRTEQSRKIDILSELNSKLTTHETLFDQQMNIKLRQKNIQIDQLKDRNKRLEQKYQQIKNRLFNEQKRQEDYNQSLKNQINNLNFQLQIAIKENKKNQDQLGKTYRVCDQYKFQIKKLLEEVQFLHRQKKHMQHQEIMKMKDNNMKKQLQAMSLQDRYMRQMQSLLNAQKDEKAVLLEKIQQLQKMASNHEQEYRSLNNQRQIITELVEIKNEEINQLKKHLTESIGIKKQYNQEIQEANKKIAELQYEVNCLKQQKMLDHKKKTENLRQIKQILQNN